jgi:adenine-specific DNA-methyltransferase
MGVNISYMGTKRLLSRAVSDVARTLPRGTMLDAFSGMCAVGEAVGAARQIWTNDTQLFPALVGKKLFCSRSAAVYSPNVMPALRAHYARNLGALRARFEHYLHLERRYFESERLGDLLTGNTELPYVGSDPTLEAERAVLSRQPRLFPYRLATITYAGTFFGASQCMSIDSLRYAIDQAFDRGDLSREQRDWMLVALGQALALVNSSTGQFAEYLKPNAGNIARILEKRVRSVWAEFLRALDAVSPVGTIRWRRGNGWFNRDAISLLTEMRDNPARPRVIYADPPYSEAQYSRYYHVLDVITEYNYPAVTGVGRYPGGRYQTPFSLSGRVSDSMERLVESAAALDACLVLSYPENGLFIRVGGDVSRLLRRFYRRVERVYREVQDHSTFGGSRAAPKVPSAESVYVGMN